MTYEVISRNRKKLMGFATVWIAFLHATMWFHFPVLQAFKLTGYCGVDLFMFLSSFGLYYSYKYGKKGYGKFVKRRLRRIMPVYLLASLMRSMIFHDTVADAVLRLSTLSFWLRGDTSMWFIAALLPLYLLTPLYLKHFHSGREKKLTVFMYVAGLLLGVFFRYDKHNVLFFRISIFFLGFLAGNYSDEKKQISIGSTLCGTALMIIALSVVIWGQLSGVDLNTVHLGWAIFWLPAMFFTGPLAVWLSVLFEKVSLLSAVLDSFGEMSLEFYLFFELMINVCGRFIFIPPPYDYHGILFNALVMIITCGFSYLLLKAEKNILRRQ